jgi:hypothetical protein
VACSSVPVGFDTLIYGLESSLMPRHLAIFIKSEAYPSSITRPQGDLPHQMKHALAHLNHNPTPAHPSRQVWIPEPCPPTIRPRGGLPRQLKPSRARLAPSSQKPAMYTQQVSIPLYMVLKAVLCQAFRQASKTGVSCIFISLFKRSNSIIGEMAEW